MLRNKLFHRLFSTLDIVFRGHGINNAGIENLARLVYDRDFTASPVRRVESKRNLALYGRL